jgi:glucose-1-phosphate thymidylyltransferase
VVAGPDTYRDLARLGAGNQVLGIEVSYREASETDRRRTVLSEVERALSDGPVMLHPGDSLFRGQVIDMRERFQAGDVDTVLPAQASVEPLRHPDDRRASDTMLLLGPGTRSLVSDLLSPKSDGEDLVSALLHSECRLAVCEQTDHWTYSDTTEALLAANRMMLDAMPAVDGSSPFCENNRLHGRVAISPSAFVSDCVIHGPVSIAEAAVVEDSFVGPYTAIGPGVILSGAEVDNSMVLAAAEIRHPGSRIEGSIIGERARITRAFELPSGLHMRLGADSRVTLT